MNKLQYLIRFLKEYNILYAFLDAYIEMRFEDKNNTTYQMAIKNLQRESYITRHFISIAFSWDKTKQGFAFWEKIQNIFYFWWDERNVESFGMMKERL